LKAVPDHTVNFLRIGLFVSMFMAVRNPLMTSAQAYGDVKKYQFVVMPILLMVCPISYVFLKLGGIPETTSFVMLFIIIMAVFASAYMLGKMVHLNFKEFIQKVMYKIAIVTVLSFILPAITYYFLDEGIIRLFVLTIVSTISCFGIIFSIGLTNAERSFIISVIEAKLNRKAK